MHRACGVNDPACSLIENFDFLRDFELICKKDLAPIIRGQDGCLMKKPKVENLVAHSLQEKHHKE
jgi:hypothetical protein